MRLKSQDSSTSFGMTMSRVSEGQVKKSVRNAHPPRVILSRRVSDVSKDPMGLWLTSFVGSFDYVALRSG
jgi:hypothetical protein